MAPRGRGGWRGSGSNRGRPWRSDHRNQNPRPTRPCQHFALGRCSYGASCKFSHDEAALPRQDSSSLEAATEELQVREKYFDFKRQLRNNYSFVPMSSPRQDCIDVWALATEVIATSSRETQSIARDLADDEIGGLLMVQKTIRVCVAERDDEHCLHLARMFLQTVTHSSLLRSLSIDSFVGTIYRVIGGSNGDGGIVFFANLTRRLSTTSESPKALLALLVSALYELLRRERKCLLHDDLPALLGALEDKVTAFGSLIKDTAATTSDLTATGIQIDRMMRMMDNARGRLQNEEPDQSTTARDSNTIHSTFPMDVVVPGGKHDNDFADVTKVQIFPTLGEITSDAAEYLPTTDFTQASFLADPVQRHLDTAFRLLRHDTFGPLKDLVGTVLSQANASHSASSSQFTSGNMKAHSYTRANIHHVFIQPKSGFETVLSFAQPPQLRNQSASDRRRWWQESSRLEQGGLVCFISTDGEDKAFLLFVVTRKSTEEVKEEQNKSTLVSNHSNPSITAKLACETQQNLALLTRMYVKKQQGLLIDLPGLIPETFVPILENLQRMMRDGDLAFRHSILPATDRSNDQAAKVPPPAYARRPGFRFRLDAITQDGAAKLSIDPDAPFDSIAPETLEAATGLDRGQSEALIASLTREYALMQGPPGTGKSHVGVQLVRVLLDHKKQAELGPILVICYTNHALDQFLKHLLDVGIDKVIRIGGQSRAEELEGKNLRVVSKNVAKTSVENRILGKNYSELDTCLETAGNRMKPIHQTRKARLSWDHLRPFLERRHPRIATQFKTQDEDGFTRVGESLMGVWLGKKEPSNWRAEQSRQQYDIAELVHRAEQDVNSLTQQERWTLAESWLSRSIQNQSDLIFELLNQAKNHKSKIDSVHADVSRRTLSQADVVGVTTTGLARNIKMLRRVGIKVIICEEAAEVMEPHIISALMPGVEHFIQIGDHRQLRPQIQNYLQFSLETPAGRAYQLDRSQFERRAVGEPGLAPLPVAQLNVQRRMRPEISALIRSVYPNLKDHESVQNLPSVVGMRKNLFWLDHNHPETSRDDGVRVKSHSNPWEVSMAAALVRHLVRQGEYTDTDIALLTPYTGQLQKLRAALSKDFEVFLSDRDREALEMDGFDTKSEEEAHEDNSGPAAGSGGRKPIQKKQLLHTIRLATVDNFQGEEAKVIVVSLVRSNTACKVGFLRTENRINVLLSRAQHGMYLIGNANTYLNVRMWADVHQQLSNIDAVGQAIALCCPRHPDTPIHCSEPDDFVRNSPEGGCTLVCDQRLEPCGHRCPAPCHSQRLHDAFACLQPCPRFRSTCQHPCPKLCGEQCGLCNVKVDGVQLPCGHVQDKVACYKTLDLEAIRCGEMVEKEVPGCGHTVTVACHKDVKAELFSCPVECDGLLGCGHQCPGSCGRCRTLGEYGGDITMHQTCDKPCRRPYGTCNHACSKKCHGGEPCGTCTRQCEVRCPHSRCRQPCQKPCTPCIEKCTWSCEHQGSCSLPCAAPCNRLPCNKRCTQELKCGHQCPSFCGEECPEDLCQVCCTGTRKEARVDLMEFKSYAEIDLDETPIAVLGCGHFFTGETLDGMVGMNKVYTLDRLGNFNGLQDLSGEMSAIPTCPDCRVPIRQFATRRYNRVVNKAVLDETSKRFLVGGRQRLDELEKKITAAENELSGARDSASTYLVQGRYKLAHVEKLVKEAGQLRQDMDTEHQPTKKLFDAVMTFQRLESEASFSLDQQMEALNISQETAPPPPQPVYDQQITLGAYRLQLRIEEAMLRDIFSHLSKSPRGSIGNEQPSKLSARFLTKSLTLITAFTAANLPRLTIPTILAYARIAQLDAWYQRTKTTTTTTADTDTATDSATKKKATKKKSPLETARELLPTALGLCDSLPAETALRKEVEETMRLFEGPRYESVTPEEIAAIKAAMVSGRGGIATHAGHWYTCRNGHPFAIGECGMPMEQARCPECGAAIGGQNHVLLEGNERDVGMEGA